MANNIMKHLHLNNHVSSKQSVDEFAKKIFNTITQDSSGKISFSIDDGDGDVWKYQIVVFCERVKSIRQIKEN